MSAVHADRDEAVDLLRSAGFTITDEDSSDHGRTIIHSFGSFVGCDWDLDAAIERVRAADDVMWVEHMLGHELLTMLEGRRICFDVKAPDGVLR